MSQQILAKIENQYARKNLPAFRVGDTLAVETVIREGERQRFQTFKGLVIAIKGSGTRKMFKVRKISYGVGVEKTFPLTSPSISKITVLKTGNVRRSKLFYMRGRVGKLAMKVKPGEPVMVVENVVTEEPEMMQSEVEVVNEEVASEAETDAEPTEAVEPAETEAAATPETPAETPAETTEAAA